MGRAGRWMWLQLKANIHLENERLDRLKGAVARLTIGSFILVTGILMFLRETGVIRNRIDIWPWALITFGTMITVGAIDRLRRLK